MPPHWWLFKSCQKMLANFFHFKTAFSYYFKHNFLCVHQKVFEGNWQPNGFIMLGKHHNLGGLSAFSRCFWPAPASRRWRLWVHKQGCDAPKARNIQLPTPAFPNSWLKPQSPRWGIPLSLPERLKHFSTGDSWKTEALPERLKHFLKDWSTSWKTEALPERLKHFLKDWSTSALVMQKKDLDWKCCLGLI